MLRFKQFIQLLEVDLSVERKHPKLGELEGKLKDNTKLESDEDEVLRQYTTKSAALNLRLINYHNNGITPPNNIHTEHEINTLPIFDDDVTMPPRYGIYNLPAFDSATNKPFNRSFTMYSGIGFDPRTQMNKNNRILMPAYTSGSLDKETSFEFMPYTDESGFQHAFRLNIKHNDHGVSMSPITASEHEIILPRNTILHIHRSEIDPENHKVMVHHATIDHESDSHDFQKPIKSHLVNDLMNKIQSNTHTNEDIDQASTQGYLTQDHLDELNKQLSQKIKQGTHTVDDLIDAIKYGYITNIGQRAINSIANNPDSIDAHKNLAGALYEGIDIGQHVIDAIAKHPNSKEAHTFLAMTQEKGRDIGQTAINAIANHPDSRVAHGVLAEAHKEGRKIGQDAIDAIANHPNSKGAHEDLAEAHVKGRSIGQKAINAIANHPNSRLAHEFLAIAHKYVKDIGQTAIDAIANNPESTVAHKILVQAHKKGRIIGQDAITAIANNPDSKEAHKILVQIHKKGRFIRQTAINAIVNHPDSKEAHKILVQAHKKGRSIGEDNYNKLKGN